MNNRNINKISTYKNCDHYSEIDDTVLFYSNYNIELYNDTLNITKELSKIDFIHNDMNNKLFPQTCNNLFFHPSIKDKRQHIDSETFSNLLNAMELCSNYNIPISFKYNNMQINNPLLINKEEYQLFLKQLVRNFICAFLAVYSNIKYINYWNNSNNLIEQNSKAIIQEIFNLFKNKYSEDNFIKVFGNDCINNIRNVLFHLISSIEEDNSLLNNTTQYKNNIFHTMLEDRVSSYNDLYCFKNQKKLNQ